MINHYNRQAHGSLSVLIEEGVMNKDEAQDIMNTLSPHLLLMVSKTAKEYEEGSYNTLSKEKFVYEGVDALFKASEEGIKSIREVENLVLERMSDYYMDNIDLKVLRTPLEVSHEEAVAVNVEQKSDYPDLVQSVQFV